MPIISTLDTSENNSNDNGINDNEIPIVLIVNAKKWYMQYAQAFTTKQAARLLTYKP